MKQITSYHARDPRYNSRSRQTRVIPGSFQLNIPIQPQTNHNQRTSMLTRYCISHIHYTTHSIPQWSPNYHTPYSEQCWGVVTSWYHQDGTPCHSQSKLSRGLWVLWAKTPVLWRVWSHTTTLPHSRQDKKVKQCGVTVSTWNVAQHQKSLQAKEINSRNPQQLAWKSPKQLLLYCCYILHFALHRKCRRGQVPYGDG